MSRSLWFAVVFCLVALVGMFALTTPALADTITLSNNTPGTADGSTLARTVTVNPGDLPSGEPLTSVRITIDFDKIDGPPAGCWATPGGDPWNEEIFFYITSPAGTRVVLVESDNNGGGSGPPATYSTGDVYNGPYSVVFDDAAPSAAGPVPLSGTFRPRQPLSGFVGEDPLGVWTLTMGDDDLQDALCFAAFALELSAGVDTDLVLDKTGPASAVAGQSITYTILVTNNGPSVAPLVEVVDDLPDQVAFVDATLARSGSGPAGECAYATCQAAGVQVGEVLTMTLTGQVDPAVPAGTVLTNQANAFADSDPTPDNGDSHTTTVQAMADLQIWKNVLPDEICVAGYGFYELTVTNGGPSTAADVTVTDTLPAGITFSGGSPECSEAGGTVTCAIGALAPGATYDFLVGFDVDAGVVSGTVVTNTAAASTTTTDPNTGNDAATASFTAVECGLPEANLAIAKTVDPPAVVAGEALTFTLTITNNGPHAAEGVTVQDLFYVPMEILALDADPLDWSCDGGVTCVRHNPMAAGASEAITLVVRVPRSDEPAEYVNMAFVNADNPDPNTGDNWAMVPYLVTAQANLTITKSALVGELVAGGDEGQFSILVTNEGPSSAYDVPVADVPDAGLELVALQPGPAVPMTCTLEACTIDVLPAGQTAEIYALVAALSSTVTGTYTNTACLGDACLADEPGLVFSPGPGIAAPPPDLGPYTMTPFPADARPLYADVTNVPGPTGDLLFDRSVNHRRIGSGWVSWSHGYTGDVYFSNGATTLLMTLPPDTGAFYFYVEPDPFDWINIQATAQDGTTSGSIAVHGLSGAHYFGFYALGGVPLSSISITAGTVFAVGEFGIAPARLGPWGRSSAPVQVTAAADLTIDKTATPTICGGELITYTLAVHNAGPSIAANVVITDDLPAGVTLGAITGAPGTCSGSDPVVCAAGVLTPGQTIEFSLVVTSDTALEPGTSLENQAWVASDTPDNDPANNHDDADTNITACTDLLLHKTGPDTVVAGEFITYTIVVTNTGPSAVPLLDVKDDLPDEVAFYDAGVVRSGQGPAGLCAYAACQVPDVAAGEAVVVTLVGLVDPATPAFITLTNEAMAFADSDPTPDAYDTHDTLVFAQADLTIDKRALKDELCLGAYGLYEIAITNHGPSTSRGITVTDVLSDALVYGGGSPECVHDGSAVGGTVTCTLASLAPGQSYDFLLGFGVVPSITAGTAIWNEAEVSSATHDTGEDNRADANFTVTQCLLPEADLAITKAVDPPAVVAGEALTFTLTVTNNGPHAAEGVTVQDLFFQSIDIVDVVVDPLDWSCDGGVTCVRQQPMPAGVSETITIIAQVPADDEPGEYVNTAFVTANNPDPDTGDNWAMAGYTVTAEANLAIAKVGMPDPVIAGATILYQVQVTNSGPSVAYDVVVTDTLPAGTTFAGASPECAVMGEVVTCSLGDLGVGLPASVWIMARVDEGLADGTLVTNRACVVSTTNDNDNTPQCAADEALVEHSPLNPTDLVLTKTVLETDPVGEVYTGTQFADGAAVAGGTVIYQIVVENAGPAPATDVVVYDALPYRFTMVEAEFDHDGSPDSPIGPFLCTQESCALGLIPAGRTVTVTLIVLVEPNAPLSFDPWQLFSNEAVVQAANPDPDPFNNADSASVTVEPLVELDILKESIPAVVVPGEELTYQIHVYNYGPSDATADSSQMRFGFFDPLVVMDMLPAEIDPATVWWETSANPLNCTFGLLCFLDLPAGHETVLTIHGQVYPDVTQPFSNTALAGDYWNFIGGGTPVSATVQTLVAPEADLAVDKTGPMTVTAGGLLTYTVTVHNNGPSDAQNVVVSDTLPYGVVAASPITFNLGTVAAGETVTRQVVGWADPNACYQGKVNNVVEVTSETPDPDPTNNDDQWGTIVLSLASLEIFKSTSPDPVLAGDLVEFVLVITNTGPGCASGVSIIDELGYEGNPAGLAMESYVSTSTQGTGPLADYWHSCSSGGACVRAEPMPAGTVDTITLRLRVPASTQPGEYENYADAIWDSGSVNTWVFYQVEAAADLTIDKRVLQDELCLGAYGLYEIVVHNEGPSTAQEIMVTDVLSDALVFGGGSPECTHDGSAVGGTVTCVLPSLGPGESHDFLIGFNIASTVIGGTEIDNEATVASATYDPLPNLPASATFTAVQCLLPEADLAITKAVAPATVVAGENLTFTLTVANNGPHMAEGVTVQDLFFQSIDVVDVVVDPLDWSCDGGVTCVRQQPMPAGVSETITIIAQVPADDEPGEYVNTAFVTADNPDPDTGDNWTVAPYMVVAEADLRIEKSVIKDEICIGATSGAYGFYEIVVTNDGPSTATAITVTDVLSDALLYGGGSPECVHDGSAVGGTVTCTLASLDAGASHDFLIGFYIAPQVVDGTAIWNEAVVSSATFDPGDENRDDAVFTATQCLLPEADLAVSKTVNPAAVAAGEEITFTVTITNNGPHAAAGVVVQDLYFWSMDVTAIYVNTHDWSCDGGLTCVRHNPMDAGATDVLTFVLRIPADTEPGLYTNYAFVSADNPDPNTWDNTAMAPYAVGATADLTITKSLLTPDVVPGGTALFEIVVGNDGPSDADGVAVTDLVLGPGVLSWISSDAGDLYIPAGQTRDVLAMVRVNDMAQPGDTITNCAYVNDLPQGPMNEACAVLTVGGGADLALDKSATPAVAAGQPITYVVTVYNNGPANALNVVVTDTLPAGVTLLATSGCAEDPNGVPVCSLGDLAPQESASYTVIVLSDSSLEPGTSLENVAAVGSDTYDPYRWNNHDAADTSIGGLAGLSIDKTGPATTLAGTEITYTLVVENAGPSVAQSVAVVDDLPAGVTLVSAEVRRADGSSVPCGGTVCQVGDIAPGETVTATIIGLLDPGLAQGTVLINSASVWSDTPDDPVDNSDQVSTVVATEADLGIVKTDLGDPVQPGAGLLYEFNVTNHGPSDAVDVVVTDTLDTNVTYAGATAGCSHDGSAVGGTVTCTVGLLPAGETTDWLLAVQVGAVPGGTMLYNSVVVASTTYDPFDQNNWDDEETTVRETTQPGADLAITKVADKLSAENGQLITYTLTITNGGPIIATGVEVVEMIPSGASLVSLEARNPDSAIEFCTPAAICYLDRVTLGTVAIITTVVQVNPDFAGESLTNLAYVSGDQPDDHPDNNIASATVSITATPPIDLSLIKLATPTADCGGTITYSLQVINHGPVMANHVAIEDLLPPYVTYNGVYQVLGWHDAADGCTDTGNGIVQCQAQTLPVDQWVTFYFTVTVAHDTMPGLSLENLASVACDEIDSNLSNNADTADTTIVYQLQPFYYYLPVIYKTLQREIPGTPDLVGSFSLTPNTLTFDASDPVLITVCVENQGDAAAGPFWVDLFINPDPIPSQAELLWHQTCTLNPCYGLAWLFTGLDAHQSYCMTSEPGSYFGDQTEWPGSFAPGTTDLYLYVDNWNPDSPVLGMIHESNEANNRSELHGLIVTGEVPLSPDRPPFAERPAPR